MTEQTHESALLSRRTVLVTLAAMPLGMVPLILGGQRSPLVLEEFLPECTASLTACWHLMMGDGLSTVATQLPKYLPALEMLVQQPSRYQKTAVKLAAQGHLLMSLIALHSLNSPLREAHCWHAEHCGRESGDQALYVAVLLFLAGVLYEENKLDKSLSVYEKAMAIVSHPSNQASPLLKNKVFVNAAACYAQAGHVQEALRCLGKARELFPTEAHDEPVYLSTDHGEYAMLQWEGQTYQNLGKCSFDLPKRSRVLYTAAQASFAKVSRLDPAIVVPERLRLEIINQQAATALALNDMDRFQAYLKEGALGARALGSEKRKQEVIDNWKAARLRWPHEMVIKDLADLLL
jgi:tetratricopeptide (TPR) repeat protein